MEEDRTGRNLLPPNQQIVAPGKWPLVGEKAARDMASPWFVEVAGLAAEPHRWSLEALFALPQEICRIDIHCVTRWSKLGATFGGVSLRTLLTACCPAREAKYVSFIARSERNHSTSLALVDALDLDVLIALTCESVPLAPEHGGPVRVVVPNRYFYKSLKWLERIELLAEDRLGTWERDSGYHNHADPWREERYIAPNLDRRQLHDALQSRVFRGQDFRSMDARGHDLSGLRAENALLRDANFQRVSLQNAVFAGANLSNAHFEGAELRGASFVEADVEGANFRGADLRGVSFRGASLFGATFCAEPTDPPDDFGTTRIDDSTLLDAESLEKLTPVQQAFVRTALQQPASEEPFGGL